MPLASRSRLHESKGSMHLDNFFCVRNATEQRPNTFQGQSGLPLHVHETQLEKHEYNNVSNSLPQTK